ncbi:hypothetical protein FF38_13043, partial [Lucilia cuprina]
ETKNITKNDILNEFYKLCQNASLNSLFEKTAKSLEITPIHFGKDPTPTSQKCLSSAVIADNYMGEINYSKVPSTPNKNLAYTQYIDSYKEDEIDVFKEFSVFLNNNMSDLSNIKFHSTSISSESLAGTVNIDIFNIFNPTPNSLSSIINIDSSKIIVNDSTSAINNDKVNTTFFSPQILSDSASIDSLKDCAVILNNNTGDLHSITSEVNSDSLRDDNIQHFKEHIQLTSTINYSNINITTDDNSKLDEYNVLRKRIKPKTNPHNEINMKSPGHYSAKISKREVYSKHVADISFSTREILFLEEYYLSPLYKKIVAVLEDLGCSRYRFTINLEKQISARIYSNGAPMTHPKVLKKQQLRSIWRVLAKHEMKLMKSTNWRDRRLTQQCNMLRQLGNDQEIPSKDVARKIKSEQRRQLQRDDDVFVD